MNSNSRFFIVGCSRSGTTLLSVLLDRHSRLCVPPETAFYDEIAPLLASCSQFEFLKILQDWRRLPELNLRPEAILQRLTENHEGITTRSVLGSILDLYSESHGKARSGEKTPQHLAHVPAILEDFPHAKIFCLIRDGVDVALSLVAMPWWAPRDLKDAARLWQSCSQLAESFEARFPDRFMVIRYEDLVVNPKPTLGKIAAVLGEDFEAGQLGLTPSSVVLPRTMPWKGHALSSIDPALLNSRRAGADIEDIRAVESILRSELARRGYPIPIIDG